MTQVFLSFITLTAFFLSQGALAKVNPEFSKTSLGRSSISRPKKISKIKKRRKIYLTFSGVNHGPQEQDAKNESHYLARNNEDPNAILPTVASTTEKVGFTNELQMGYSNSAYRYAGEEYPAKSVDFALAPRFETTCFSLNCIYLAKIVGGFDLNNSGKNELGLFQLGVKFVGDPWGGYLAPGYSLLGYLPATPKEINVDLMKYGFGSAFSLATTPELLGTDFIAFSGSISLRKNIHEGPELKQQDWSSRQALITDFNFTKSIAGTLVFAHILGVTYEGTEKDLLEMIQSVKWQATDWLELNLGHSNFGPMYTAESSRLDSDIVSIEKSVISIGFGITNSF
jgi:hypothetical protein